MILYVVSTPLHVFGTCELAGTVYKEEDNRVIVCSDAAIEYKGLIDCMSAAGYRIGIIDYSTLIQNGEGIIQQESLKALMTARFFNRWKIIPELREENVDTIVIFTPNVLTAYLHYMFPNAQIVFAEDGLGSYTGAIYNRKFYFSEPPVIEKKNVAKRLFRFGDRLFFKGQLAYQPAKIFLHMPSMNTYSHPGVIEKVECTPNLVEIYNEYFNARQDVSESENYINYNCLVLGQPFLPETSINTLHYVIDTFSQNGLSVVYRRHPREQYEGEHNSGGLWEFRCLNEITNEHVIISVFSTASITPTLYFGKEPYLVFLHPIAKENSLHTDEAFESFVQSLSNSYSDPNKVFVVRGIDEVPVIAKRLRDVLADREAGHGI